MNRQGPGKIEWTDWLAHFIMCPPVTPIAKCLNIKPMPVSVTKMVMILVRLLATAYAGKSLGACYPARSDCTAYSVHGTLMFRWGRREITLPMPDRYPSATHAGSSQSVPARSINIEIVTRLPLLACSTPFQPGFNLGLIVFQRKAEASSRYFDCANLRTHYAPLI